MPCAFLFMNSQFQRGGKEVLVAPPPRRLTCKIVACSTQYDLEADGSLALQKLLRVAARLLRAA